MNLISLFEYAKVVPSTVSSFFEVKADSKRIVFSEQFPIDRMFTYGSCIPVVSQAIGTSRIFYGSVVISFALCELINKIAQSKFTSKTTFFEKIQLLKGGVAPLFLRGFEHISMGVATQTSLAGNLSCIFYEFVVKPNLPKQVTQDVSVDPECFSKLFERVKKHSLCKRIEAYMTELNSLLFSA